ncbi:MAG: transporter, partial [Akkermansiaceae bacterium]|nr:transporter [Akkermansiaceae bacterium]
FIQPFVSYTTKTSTTSTTSTTFTLNTESSYDWTHDQGTLPLNVMVQQIVKIGKQPVALSLGARDYADKPDDGPNGGLRFAVIFLFPRS